MYIDAPFRLGPFIVDVQGRLQPGDADRFPSFRVAWRGCPVHARLDVSGNGAGELGLSAVVGRVPSSAGGELQRRQECRGLTIGALQEMTRGTAEGMRLRLLPDHRFTIETSRPVHLPVSAGDLLTQIARFLLDIGPYLDLLAEAEVSLEAVGAAASRNGGIAKI